MKLWPLQRLSLKCFSLKYLPLKRWLRLVLIGLLSLSLSLVMQVPQPGLSMTPLQAGQTHYQASRYADAAQALGQAIAAYRHADQPLAEARTLALQVLALEKLGRLPEANQALERSRSILKTLRQQPSSQQASAQRDLNRVEAQIFSSQGKLLRAQGKAKAALESWETAEQLYKQINDTTGVMGSRINQIKALETLGFYRRADLQIKTMAEDIQQLPDSPLKAQGLLSLGNLLRLEGQLDASADYLQQALSIAPLEPRLQSQLLLSIANTERLQVNRALSLSNQKQSDLRFEQAISHYRAAIELAEDPVETVQIQLNLLSLLGTRSSNLEAYQSLIQDITQALPQLPVNRRSIYARVNFAKQLMDQSAAGQMAQNQRKMAIKFIPKPLPQEQQTAPEPEQQHWDLEYIPDLGQLLQQTVQQADSLEDRRSQSYALGTLGHWFETQRNWEQAYAITQLALGRAQQVDAPEIAYQWQWQLGRTLQARRDRPNAYNPDSLTTVPTQAAEPEALGYYKAAYDTLNTLRSDLVALTPDIQFSFRERVEPVYRELVDLLLRAPQPEDLIQARDVIENLQLAELDNFFRDACAQAQPMTIDDVDPHAAIVYPILLPDRLEIILKLPGKDNLRHYVQPAVTADEVEQIVREFRRHLLQQSSGTLAFKQASKKLYQWLIQPLETELDFAASRDESAIQTLAFVLDGSLKSLPMAALYDGEHYLVERYAIALTPGLQLLEPQPLARTQLKVLLGGVDNAPSFQAEGFSTLTYVPLELAQIQAQLSQSKRLEDAEFQKKTINQQINRQDYNVVHLATHGQFSSDPEQTFLLDWNGRIKTSEIDDLLRFADPQRKTAIELLVLSACETAKGDSRAALGLAGMAIRAGARSTLATMWQVDDASTAQFMIEFYQRLNQMDQTKAEALREVQLSFLRDFPQGSLDAPYYWAPFILVGNWL